MEIWTRVLPGLTPTEPMDWSLHTEGSKALLDLVLKASLEPAESPPALVLQGHAPRPYYTRYSYLITPKCYLVLL